MTFQSWQPGAVARKGFVSLLISIGGLLPTVALAEAAVSEKVVLLQDLAEIESETRLALLLSEKVVSAAGLEEAEETYEETWPEVKDRLLAAGVQDFGPLLQALGEAEDVGRLREAGRDVMVALTRARSHIAAGDAEIAASIYLLFTEAVEQINVAGPTSADDYRDAWAMILVARTEADLLLRAKDPTISKAAPKVVLALDDALLLMEVPSSAEDVEFDPTDLLAIAEGLKALIGSGA